ncbi:hypothetical protein EJV46_13265 [Roseococcus sp. SYP-B2431]|uniref:DUF6602 domain-containing protein n=1 Tax=Roseococcus sp. SYP-B2431 TaxID=2496640 RepID=UPI00103EDF7E|nr:DUF6602 domain-containing protein [Roseococcus sp. SYP-B2431]TCH98160.1 hypothetical protein EJV46_13265 [Roseococcus sp. SYP-B2431]
MSSWSLSQLLASLHQDIETKLEIVRKSIHHPGSKGDASEDVWIEMLNEYLPKRYQTAKAFVVDTRGNFSHQIDVVVFDRQYSSFIFKFQGQTVIPAESVYAVFEAKQTLNADLVAYAQEKVESVRRLHRTSIPIPHAGGVYPPKPPIHILGGMLTFGSDWTPALGPALGRALRDGTEDRQLDIGCVASHGHFFREASSSSYHYGIETKPATAFLFKMISRLQFSGTVPMIDVDAYAEWLVERA